jgi:para-nitrobenzyl esterase
LGPVPIVGDAMLPRSIADTFAAGGEAPYPLIMSNTSDDASVVSAFGFDPAELVKTMGAAGLGLKLLYPGVKDQAELGRQALRDVVFTMNPRWVADRHGKRAKTYRAYFNYTAIRDRAKFPNGVPHGNDIQYFLDTLAYSDPQKARFTAADKAFARKTSGYIFEFARTGVPRSKDAPEWQDDRLLRDRTLVFGPDKIELKSNFMRARLSVMIGLSKIADTLFSK